MAPALPESAFVAADPAQLREILCVQEERIVARDNTVAYEGRRLQLPQSPLRAHYVKARVVVREYPDDTLAVFHGPRLLARYDATGEAEQLKADVVCQIIQAHRRYRARIEGSPKSKAWSRRCCDHRRNSRKEAGSSLASLHRSR